MEEWIIKIIGRLDYGGIAILMLLENLFPPLPSELIMPLAGFAASRGEMRLDVSIAAGVLGSWLGTLPWYFLGAKWGRVKSRDFLSRYGKWMRITPEDFDKAETWFTVHGMTSLLIGRLVPGIRTVISFPAGILRIPFFKYSIYTLVGTALWNSLLAIAGYGLGSRYHLVQEYIGPFSLMILGTITLLLLIGFFRKRKAGERSE